MSAKRWLWISFALLMWWTGSASAQVSMTPDPINVGNVLVGGMGSADGTLASGTNGVNVDVVLTTTCSGTGTGTFSLTSNAGTLTNLNLNAAKTITATYMPATRGTRQCTVNVFDAGMPTLLASFTVRGTGIAPVIGTTPVTMHAFPAVRFNNAAPIHSVTVNVIIANNGDTGTDLVVTDVSPVGGLSGDYSVSGTLPATIAVGSPATFVVTFDPAMAGASSTTLQIASTDPITPTKNINLTGTGATGVIGVTDIAFGIVQVGTSAPANVTISNTGTGTRGPLGVTQATFMNNTGWFRFNQPGCVGSTTTCNLAVSLTTTTAPLAVTCNPPTSATAGQAQSAMIAFTSDTDSATDSVAMVSCTAGRADMAVVMTPLAFGDQLVNTPSMGQSVMISNSGNIPLTYSLSVAGTDPSHFLVTGFMGCTTNCSVPAGMSVSVSAAFRPTTVGPKSAALRVTASNDPDTTSLDVPMSGNGVAPVSAPSDSMFAFGNVDVGDMAMAETLTVVNNGTYPLSITAAYLSAGGADYVTTGTTGTSISIMVPPMQTATWTIACRPSVFGNRPGTFRITSNHNGVTGTNQDIGLSCTGMQGILVFVPGSLYDFGGVREGETRMQGFTLRNNGNAPVTNITAAFTGTGTGYTFAPTTIASLAGGATTTVTVTFAPLNGTYGGVYTGTYTGMWGNSKTTMASQSVNGDGLTTGYDTLPSNPNALEFGDVRFDQTKSMNVSIVNTAGTALVVRGLSITPGTAQSGEFSIVACRKNGILMACPSVATPYNSSGINDTIVVQVMLDPNNRLAMMDATLTVSSDLANNPNRTVLMRGTSITAGIGLNPTTMVLDFGPVDLDATPVAVTRTVTLTNTGAAPLDFLSVTKVGGPLGNARFTFSPTTAPFTLQPNVAYPIQVTYTPIDESPANQPDTGQIIFGGVSGVFGGNGSITIELRGYGVDRHIDVGPAPIFPDTYTNPGDQAPVLPVKITNNGDAELDMSGVMVTNEPIWSLDNPDPIRIGGRQTHDFMVRFSPLMPGKAPTGRLTIINNDNGMPMVSVDLDGNGLDRQIKVGPPTIDLGYVGIGMTVRLSEVPNADLLSVDNMGGDLQSIGDIVLSDPNGAFDVQTVAGLELPDEVPVAARASEKFDVLFTPPFEGEHTASATVHIKTGANSSDPRPAVLLKGRGIYVETSGGGGCSTGRGGGIAMVLVMFALVIGRRRLGALAIGVVAAAAAVAQAGPNDDRNVSLSLFDPTPTASATTTFQLQDAEVADKGAFGLLTLVSYANKPLILKASQNDDPAIENRTTLELGGVYSFGAFEVGLRMPFFLQSGAEIPNSMQRMEMFGVAPGEPARGDATAHIKFQIGARGNVSYGLAGAITAPTASRDQFAGNELPTGRALFLLSSVHGPITLTVNAGGVARASAQLGDTKHGSGAVWGTGLSWRVLDKMWLAGEMFGELIPGGASGQPAPGELLGPPELGKPIEWLLGMRYQMARATSLGIAAGRGLTSDMGTPMVRGVLTLAYTPSAQEPKPLRPPRPPEPEKDADSDSIKDELDTCPNEPEDKDLFDDADGCPDLDNDADGLADAADKCPLDAEDKDRFKD
ncbi:MAG TPA: choice-of-anchor D domain-containing protein, partial [Kofleriaceae bacterium]